MVRCDAGLIDAHKPPTRKGAESEGNMATRKNLSHDARTREKIRTSQLINRLEKFVLNEDEVSLSPAQVSAALGLIKKTLPDLAQVDSTVDLNAKVVGQVVFKGLNADG